MKKLLILFSFLIFALPLMAQVNINAASGGSVVVGSPSGSGGGCSTANLISNGCTGGTTAQGAVASLGATGWLTGSGAPSATCSSSTNNGYFYTSSSLALYQCSNITGPYLWSVLAPAGVISVNGLTGALNLNAGTGIAVGTSSPNITVNLNPGTICNPAGQFSYGNDANDNALCSPLPAQPSSQYIAPQAVAGCGVQWVSGLSYTVGACTYTINGVTYNSPLSTITLPAADPSNPEIDAIYVGTAQTVQFLQGTAAPDPLQPTVNPATQLALTFVLVPAGSTTPANTAQVEIYLDDSDHWTPTVGGTSSAQVNFNSTNNPYQGTQDTEFGTSGPVSQTTFVQYTDPAAGTVSLSNYNSLVFYLRNKAAWPSTGSVTVQWFNGSTAVGSGIVLSSGAFGFNSTTNTTSYQQIWIPTTLFGAASNPVTSVRFTVSGTGAALSGFYLDYVTLQGGVGSPLLPATLMNWKGTWSATATYSPNDTVVVGNVGYVALQTSTNQVVTNAAFWAPLSSGGASYTAGTGISLAGNVITNLGNTDINAVTDLGMDNAGTVDGSSILQTELNSGSNLSIYFPCGQYKLNSGVLVSATSTTAQNLKLYAASPGCVRFNSTFAGDILWFDNTTSSTDNNFGPTIDGIIFNDISGSGAVHSCVRLTEYAYFFWNNLRCTNATGKQFQTGTVSVANGSTAVTGSGTAFTSAMVGGRFWINGKMQEVASVGSGTSLTLVDPWQYPTASTAAYSLDYNGVGLLFDGGTSYTQYGVVANYYGLTDAVGVQAQGSSAGGIGVSRIRFYGGEINSSRTPDSIGFMLGDTSDTIETNTPINNVAIGWALENSHANKISGADLENQGAYTVVSTCNGGVASQACVAGLISIGQTTSNARNNTIEDTYIYNTGTAVSWDQYSYYFTAIGNRILPAVNTTVFAPPAVGTTGYTTATVYDFSLSLTPSLIISGIATSPSTSPICPNGTGGALTTAGCAGGSTGFPITLGSTSIASGSTTTSLVGLTVNGVTLSSSGSAGLFLTQAGTYAAPSGSGIVGNCTTAGALAYYAATGTTITCDANALTDGSGGLTAKTITLNGSTNFYVNMTTAGILPTAPGANTIQMTVPNSVTAYAFELPAAQPADSSHTFLSCTAANPSVCSFATAGAGTVTTTGSPASGDITAFSGATSITTATNTQINTLIKTLTGCNTASNVYTPQAGDCVAPSAGGSPGGSTTQLQYNNAGSFGGTAGITYPGTAGFLNLASTAAYGSSYDNGSLISNVNSVNITTLWGVPYGASIISATTVPSGANVAEIAGIASFVQVLSGPLFTNNNAGIGIKTKCEMDVAAGYCFGAVLEASSTTGNAAAKLEAVELHENVANAGDSAAGALDIEGTWAVQPTTPFAAVYVGTPGGAATNPHYSNGIQTGAGAATNIFEAGPSASSGSSLSSQLAVFDSVDSGSTQRQSTIKSNAAGNFVVTPFGAVTDLVGGLNVSTLAGGGTQCVQVDNSGNFAGTASGCGSGTGSVLLAPVATQSIVGPASGTGFVPLDVDWSAANSSTGRVFSVSNLNSGSIGSILDVTATGGSGRGYLTVNGNLRLNTTDIQDLSNLSGSGGFIRFEGGGQLDLFAANHFDLRANGGNYGLIETQGNNANLLVWMGTSSGDEGGTVQVRESFNTGTVAGTGDVVAFTTSADTVSDCAVSCVNAIGIETGTNSNSQIQSTGKATVNLDVSSTVAVGDILCTSPTTAGKAHDNGTAGCSTQLVGFADASGSSVTTISAYLKIGSGGAAVSNALTSITAGSGATVTCATATCTNLRGTLSVTGGTFTTGTLAALLWPTTTTAYACTATMNGGTAFLGIGNSVATATGMNVTAALSVAAATFSVNYSCRP